MSAYLIFIRDKMIDSEEMKIYGPLAQKSLAGHAFKALAFYGAAEALEGPAVDGVVVMEFETMEAARAWYDSPAYQEAKAHRLKGADYRVAIAAGV